MDPILRKLLGGPLLDGVPDGLQQIPEILLLTDVTEWGFRAVDCSAGTEERVWSMHATVLEHFLVEWSPCCVYGMGWSFFNGLHSETSWEEVKSSLALFAGSALAAGR